MTSDIGTVKDWQARLTVLLAQRWLLPFLLATGLALSFAVSWFELLDAYVQLVLMDGGINIILAASLNLINGYMGEFSVGHAGFMAVGAYMASVLTVWVFPPEMPWLFPLAIIAGGLAAGLVGLLVAIPSFKTRDDYLAIVTLALNMIVKSVLENVDALGGPRGFLGMERLTTLPAVFCWTVISVWIIRNLIYSNFGRGILAVRALATSPKLLLLDEPAAGMNPILSVEELTVSYGNIRAVKGISFEVGEGEIVTLIGANGAGKSSALRGISGLEPYAGCLVYKGQDLRNVPADELVSLGIVQVPEGRGIFGNLTVLENLRLATWKRKDKIAIAIDLDRVFTLFPRLEERIDQLGGNLSGGEQQMLALGRALMSRGKILLLDEPSMGLAPLLVREIFRVLTEINRTGTTILLVEQNANLALRIAARGYVLETGNIVLSGTGQELLGNPRVKEAYLGG